MTKTKQVNEVVYSNEFMLYVLKEEHKEIEKSLADLKKKKFL